MCESRKNTSPYPFVSNLPERDARRTHRCAAPNAHGLRARGESAPSRARRLRPLLSVEHPRSSTSRVVESGTRRYSVDVSATATRFHCCGSVLILRRALREFCYKFLFCISFRALCSTSRVRSAANERRKLSPRPAAPDRVERPSPKAKPSTA